MLVVKAKNPIKFSFNGYDFTLKRKEKLLFANDVFALLPDKIKKSFEKAHTVLPPLYQGENLNGKTLFVFLQAAIGDALCITPALREIKRKYPECKLWVAISGRSRPVLEGLPYIDKLLPHPAPIKEVVKADYMVKAVEMVGKSQFNKMNMIEYFLWKFHLAQAEKETPDVIVDENIKKELEPLFEKAREVSGKSKILLFHYLASSVHRTLPPRLLKKIEDLIWEEYAPVICSLPEEDITVEIALDLYGIRAANFSSYMKNIKYLIAAVSLADAVITADTATVHIAGALNKPTVLISGAIEPELRCKTYPTVIPLRPNYTPKVYNCPCGIHGLGEPCPEAQNLKQFYSPCLESIPGEVIYYALKDAEKATEIYLHKRDEQPEKCPLCENKNSFTLVEIINGFQVFECPSCGLQFSHPMKPEAPNLFYTEKGKIQKHGLIKFANLAYENYKDVAENKEEEFKRWAFTPRFRVLFPILEVLPKGTLFDVGCSTGMFMIIAEKFGFKVRGMDASEEAIKIAKEKFDLDVICASDIEELPEDWKGPYDVVTSFEVLEHTEKPLKFLKEFFSLLKEPGILILSVPAFYSFPRQCEGEKRYLWWLPDYPPHHLTRWKPWTLEFALKKVGFKHLYLFTEPLIPMTLIEKIFIKEVTLKDDNERVFSRIPKDIVKNIIWDAFSEAYLNSRLLGKFQIAIAIKGNSLPVDLEKMIKRAIIFSGVDLTWGRDEYPL